MNNMSILYNKYQYYTMLVYEKEYNILHKVMQSIAVFTNRFLGGENASKEF